MISSRLRADSAGAYDTQIAGHGDRDTPPARVR